MALTIKTGNVIKPCLCFSKFQDERYGKGLRVWTFGPKQGRSCSVCGRKLKE